MGQIRPPEAAFLLIGLLGPDPDLFGALKPRLTARFGPLLRASRLLDFKHTDYYLREMGPDLKRQFFIFRRPFPTGRLAAVKLFTNRLESELSRSDRRLVNLDPGYLTLAKLVLASTKNYSHRLYLGRGIYGELTFVCHGGKFETLAWTYPDYRSPEYREFFERARLDLLEVVKKRRGAVSVEDPGDGMAAGGAAAAG